MNRKEHLAWCKERALECVKIGDLQGALASLFSDLRKHEETKTHSGILLGLMLMLSGCLETEQEVVNFIDSFN